MPSLPNTRRRTVVGLGSGLALASACAVAPGTSVAGKSVTKPRFPNKSLQCMRLPLANSQTFAPEVKEAKPFGTLGTELKYRLTLRGIYHFTNRKDTNGKRVPIEHFYPRDFTLEGRTTASATAHPKDAGYLRSRTEVRLDSSRDSVKFSFGFPPSLSVSYENGDKTTRITGKGKTRTDLTVGSLIGRGDNAVRGKAGDSNGLYKVRMKSFVAAGTGTNPYESREISQLINPGYTSKVGGIVDGLAGCGQTKFRS